MANLATINNNILADSGIDPLSLIVGTGTVNYVPKFTAEDTVANSQIFDNGTNIGIGTTSPSAKLNVVSSSLPTIISNTGTGGVYQSVLSLRSTSPSYGAGVQFYDGTNDGYISWYNQGLYFAGTGGATRMLIDSSGKLLVGGTTNTYGARVSVENGFLAVSESGGSDILLRAAYGSGNPAIQVIAAVPLVFTTSNTERMRIDADGRVLINRTSSTGNGYYLQVTNGISASSSLLAQGTLSGYSGAGAFLSYETYGGRLEAYDYSTTSWKNIAIAPNGGNVGIGTSSPSSILHVVGQESRFGGVASGFISLYNATYRSGYLQANGGVDFRIASDTDPMTFYVNGSERMRITSGGNVLVGTTTDVSGVGKFVINYASSDNYGIILNNTYTATSNNGYFQRFYNNGTEIGTFYAGNAAGSLFSIVGKDGLSFATNGAPIGTERMRIATTGAIRFNAYGAGSFTGTVAYNLAVDASGNIIETAGGVVDGSGTANYVPKWSDPNTLTNSMITDDGTSVVINGSSTTYFKVKASTNSGIDLLQDTAGTGYLWNRDNAAILFGTNNTERMRLTSTGLGIGTTTFATDSKLAVQTSGGKFDVRGIGVASIVLESNGGMHYNAPTGNFHKFQINNSTLMELNGSGNLGLGVTPSAWSAYTALQIKNSAYYAYTTSDIHITGVGSNIYYDGSQNTYIANGFASTYLQLSGEHRFYTAGSGTAGNAISLTQAMTLDASGNLGLGTTSPASGIGGSTTMSINGTSWALTDYFVNGTRTGRVAVQSGEFRVFSQGSVPLLLGTENAERMRITSGGNVGISTTSPIYKLDVQGTSGTVAIRAASNTADDILFYATGTVTGTINAFNSNINATANVGANIINTNSSTGGSYVNVQVPSASSGNPRYILTTSGATNWSMGIKNSDSDKLYIGATDDPSNGSPVMTMTTGGLVGIGTTNPSYKLDITANNNASIAIAETSDDPFIWFDRSDGGSSRLAWRLRENATRSLIFETGSSASKYGQTFSEAMRITSGGLVGIGTSAPGEKLEVSSTTNSNVAIKISNSGTSGYIQQNATSGTGALEIASGGAYPLVLGTNGTERMRITSGGNVGIGTTSPSGQLHIKGASGLTNFGDQMLQVESSTSNYSGIVFSGTNGSNAAIRSEGASTMTFWTATGTTYTERMRITSGGDININMPNSTNRYLSWYSANGVYQVAAVSSITHPSYNDAGYLIFSTAKTSSGGFTEKMRIEPNGNVGIGTTNPGGARLNVQSTSTYMHIGNTDDTRYMDMGMWVANRAQIEVGNGDFFIKTQQSNDLFFGTNSAERMRITSGGNVGIANTNPTVPLDVAAGTSGIRIRGGSATSYLHFNTDGSTNNYGSIEVNNDASSGTSMRFYNLTSGSLTEKMRVTAAGEIWMGYTSDQGAYLLQVNGTIYASGDVIAYSDASVKNNIRPIDNVLSRISNSRGVLYDRTDKDEKDNIGFIAQELEQQFPELVSTNKDGTKGVKYQNAVAVLFEAIKELKKEINELK